MIKKIVSADDMVSSTLVLRKAFSTVASQFNLTEENCPTNSAFIQQDALFEMQKKGVHMFGLFDGEAQAGFVAIEKSTEELYYLEKLAVLPAYRHKGYGIRLMDFASDFVRQQGGKEISIGIVNENSILKEWYRNYGFQETGLREYEHLPFTVCFMKKYI